MNNRQKWLLFAVILLAILLRVSAALYLGNKIVDMPGTADQLSYHNLALRVLSGHGFSFGQAWWPATAGNAPTAHWSYLYTAYLVFVYALFGPNPLAARLLQAVLVGALQPVLAYQIGQRVFNKTVGLFAALLIAVYAYFVYYAATLMTESFYISAILGSFYVAISMVGKTPVAQEPARDGRSRLIGAGIVKTSAGVSYDPQPGLNLKRAVLLGLTLGAAVLLRQLFLLFIPFIFLWILLSGRRQIRSLVLSTLVILLMILPFTAYNYSRFGRFVLLNTNAGFAFFWGNHPIYGTHFIPILPASMGSYQDLIPKELRSLDEAALDQALLARGLQFVQDDPRRYLLLSLSRIPDYFMFWPSPESELMSNIARVTSFGLLWPFMLYGLVLSLIRHPGSLRVRPPSPILLFYMFIIIYSAIHVLSWTLIRYRLPVDAILILFASLGIMDLFERVPVLHRLVNLATHIQIHV